MKRAIAILVVAAFLITIPVSAANNGGDGKGNGNSAAINAAAIGSGAVNGTIKGTDQAVTGAGSTWNQSGGSVTAQANKNKSAGQGTVISANLTSTERNRQEIKEQIMLISQENLKYSDNSSDNRLQNQNIVRTAVRTLLAAGNISGGIGDRISAIAKEFNNSVTAQYIAKEKIRNRDAISKFFFGGDKEASEEIQQHIEANRARIEDLNALMNQCSDCDDELKAMIREQIQILEEEQNRLQGLSQAELNDNGLFGGFFL